MGPPVRDLGKAFVRCLEAPDPDSVPELLVVVNFDGAKDRILLTQLI